MDDDRNLLRTYAEEGSQDAFKELVSRHVGWIFAMVRTRLGGDAHGAEEVVQDVFRELARKAGAVAGHPSVSAWLHRAAHYRAIDAVRAAHRRRRSERAAEVMNAESGFHKQRTGEIPAGLLDEMLNDLKPAERAVVMLRYFERRPFAEIGRHIRSSEDAARMRVDRALEKMRSRLALRGIVSSAAAIGEALAAQAGATAPAGLAASIAAGASASVGASAGMGASMGVFLAMTKIQIAFVAAALAAGSATLSWQWEKRAEEFGRGRGGSVGAGTGSASKPEIGRAAFRPSSQSPGAGARPTIADLLAETDIPLRMATLAGILTAADEAAVKAMLAEVHAAPHSLAKWRVLEAIYQRWGQLAPRNALAAVESLPRRERRGLETIILRGWAETDVDSAWAWATTTPVAATDSPAFPESTTERTRNLVEHLTDQGRGQEMLDRIVGMANQAKPGVILPLVLNDVLLRDARYRTPELIEWALALPEGPELLRFNAVMRLTLSLADESPEAAIGLIGRLQPDESAQVVRIFLEQLGMKTRSGLADNRQAAEWVARLPAGALRDSALAGYIEGLVPSDPRAAAALVASVSSPELRRQAMLTSKAGLQGDGRFLDWVLSFPDYPNQAAVLRDRILRWSVSEPSATRSYLINQPALTPEQRDSLLKLLPETNGSP